LSENLLKKLTELYPLRGKVSEVKGEEIGLNIGETTGVSIGQRFVAIGEDVTLQVTSVEPDRSFAEIVTGKQVLHEGDRVEAI
jgi:hypothetical protein